MVGPTGHQRRRRADAVGTDEVDQAVELLLELGCARQRRLARGPLAERRRWLAALAEAMTSVSCPSACSPKSVMRNDPLGTWWLETPRNTGVLHAELRIRVLAWTYRSQLPPTPRRMHLHLALLQLVHALPYGAAAALGADSAKPAGPGPPPPLLRPRIVGAGCCRVAMLARISAWIGRVPLLCCTPSFPLKLR